jgi:N6-adenosine-specific RNA methylase IME4
MTDLVRYDAACTALAAAVKADEVMSVRLEAKAIEAVARVAKNFDLEINAVKLRTRAEARLGEMLEQGERQGIIAARGRPKKDSESECFSRATLKDIGVDPKLSAQSRRLSSIGQQAVDVMLAQFEQESRQRGRLAVDVISGATAKRNADSRRELARELSNATALKPTGRKFAVLYADPAYKRQAGVGSRAYENHYVTMTWEDILAMPVADRLLPDAQGYVWIPRAHLLALVETEIETPLGRCRMKIPLAWAIQIKWGFDSYSTCVVWTKTDEEVPNDHGLGLMFWDQDEILLVFKRGRGLPKPDTDKKCGSNHRERAGRHSAKPAFYRQMINDMTGSLPVLELFAREDADNPLPPNYFTWGNESKNTAEIECDEPSSGDTGEIEDAAAATVASGVVPADAAPMPLVCRPVVESVEISIQSPPATMPLLTRQADDDLDIPAFLRRSSDNSVPSVASPREAQSVIGGEAG